MTNTAVSTPFQAIMDLSGLGLSGGKVYIGVVGEDPQTNPQAVYWDADGTDPATQPLDVLGGYTMRLGSPAVAYTLAPYSMRVRTRQGVQVFYEAAVYPGLTVESGMLRDGSNVDMDSDQAASFRNAIGALATVIETTRPEAGAIARTLESKNNDLLSVKDFGAIGDAFFHPLSERYSTLLEAQDVYPFVTSLTQSIDGAAIQAALNAASLTVNTRGTAFMPDGYYVLSDSLEMPSHVTLMGASAKGSVLFNQLTPLTVPAIVSKAPDALIFASFKSFSIYGGTHGFYIDCTDEVANLTFDSVGMVLQTEKNVEVVRQLQTSLFINCYMDGSNAVLNCVRLAAGQNNNNVFIRCDFLNSTDAHLFLNAGNGNTFIGCRFEGGGGASFDGKRTLQINAAESLSFRDCYFESTHEYLMESAASGPSITFEGCTFIGPVDSGDFRAYKWLTNDTVTFSTNYFYKATTAPTLAVQTGINANLALPISTVASAATITLPRGQEFVTITGTTAITSITATTADAQRSVTLGFAGIVTVTDGSNLKLAGNFVTSADDTLTLISDGTNWYERSRSAN